ncbi:MAG: phage tail tip lysozyme [Candidatus Pacearchaeota archaeon]
MVQQSMEKTIYLVLIILVIVFVIILLTRPQIIDFFKNLPYNESDHLINVTKDEYAKLGICIGEDYVGNIKLDFIYIYDNNKEIKTDFYIKDNKIYKAGGKFLRELYVGYLSNQKQIKIDNYYLSYNNKLDYTEVDILRRIHNSYFSLDNKLCRPLITFICDDRYIIRESPSEIEKYYENESLKFLVENIVKEYPRIMNKESFKALLISIINEKNFNTNEEEIKNLGEELRNAFDNKNEKYEECYNSITEEEKFTCILSIYKTGKNYHNRETEETLKSIGHEYSQKIKMIYRKWQYQFCMGENEEKTREGETEKEISEVEYYINFLKNFISSLKENTVLKEETLIIYYYLKDLGYEDEQIAGIIGNLIQESNLDPFLEGDCKNNKCTSIGLAQWHNERKDALLKDCPKTKTPEGQRTNEIKLKMIFCQLDFLNKELNKEPYKSRVLKRMEKLKNVRDITILFQNEYEKCNSKLCNTNKRIEYAEAFYNIIRHKEREISGIRNVLLNLFTFFQDRNYKIDPSSYDYLASNIGEGKSRDILRIANSYIGKDTIRYGCKDKARNCKDFVCARFVSNILREAGINIEIRDSVPLLEKEILKNGGVKIYDYLINGEINTNNKEQINEILKSGYIGVFRSEVSNSGYHIVILNGYDPKTKKVLFIHDSGYKKPVNFGSESIKKLRAVYKIT